MINDKKTQTFKPVLLPMALVSPCSFTIIAETMRRTFQNAKTQHRRKLAGEAEEKRLQNGRREARKRRVSFCMQIQKLVSEGHDLCCYFHCYIFIHYWVRSPMGQKDIPEPEL